MNLVLMRGEIHGHVHNKKDEKVKTAAVMRQKAEPRLSRCPVDGKSNASDATFSAIPSVLTFEDTDDRWFVLPSALGTRQFNLYIHLGLVCNMAP